jgi:nickel/cobalt transporter (NicO) family protein
MDQTLSVLFGTAVTLGFVHTIIGIDHSLPFIVIGRAQKWSFKKVLGVTTLCGVGHVMASVLLGVIGISFGLAVERMELLQERRGELAAWLLIGFGLAYAAWALFRTLRGRSHSHLHLHAGAEHAHDHDHQEEHLHPHGSNRRFLTVWALFIIFAFGPCEALIPLLMVPAFSHNWMALIAVAAVFGIVTVGTMLAVVTAGFYGLNMTRLSGLERHVHTLAGLTIAISGLAIMLLGI